MWQEDLVHDVGARRVERPPPGTLHGPDLAAEEDQVAAVLDRSRLEDHDVRFLRERIEDEESRRDIAE